MGDEAAKSVNARPYSQNLIMMKQIKWLLKIIAVFDDFYQLCLRKERILRRGDFGCRLYKSDWRCRRV